MYIDEDFMVHVHVYLFLMSLDPVPCFILTITENLTNPVPKYVGEMENRRFYETYKTSWNISLALGPHYLVFLYNTLYGIR